MPSSLQTSLRWDMVDRYILSLYFTIRASERSKSGSDREKVSISILSSLLRMGRDTNPSFCLGRSATRKSNHVLFWKENTPGLRTHSTIIPSILGLTSLVKIKGFSANLFTMLPSGILLTMLFFWLFKMN